MGLFKVIDNGISLAKEGVKLASEATVDKDKLLDLKQRLEELESEGQASARTMAVAELSDPNKLRSLQRPLWSMICLSAFALQVLSIVAQWFVHIIGSTKEVVTLVFPLPVNAVILAVVTFYFGGRLLERQNTTNKFFEKWGV